MSSDMLWRPIDVSKFGLIYAGAQKNLGPAGITVLIMRKDLAERSPKTLPTIFRYKTILAGDSLQNTIPTFAVYMVRNVLRWIRDQGGAAAMEKRNREKAGYIYGMIDENPTFFRCPVSGVPLMMNPMFHFRPKSREEVSPGGCGRGRYQGSPLGRRHSCIDLQRDGAFRRPEVRRLQQAFAENNS
jgi:phosphoserine aminotransferase